MTSHLLTSILTFFNLPSLPIFLLRFWTIQGKLKGEKIFQYLKYEQRYDILNLDKFGAQKRENPFVNKTKFKSFIVESPLVFKLHITHLYYCWKVKGKEIWKKKIPNCEKNLKNSFVTS